MYKESPLLARAVAALLAVLVLHASLLAPLATAATLYEQTDVSTLGDSFADHGGYMPVERLGTGLSGTVSSIVYKVHGTTLATDIHDGYGDVQLFACPSSSYLACGPSVASSGFAATILSQVGDDAVVRGVMTSAHAFNPSFFYYFKLIFNSDMAPYGSVGDTYPAGVAAWVDPFALDNDTQLFDFGFRICDTADCDLVVVVPDTTAPTLTTTTTTSSSTAPTLVGTTDDTAAVDIVVNSQTYSATLVGSEWSVTIPALDALADGTYTVTASSTDSSGNRGEATGSLLIDTTAPVLTLAGDASMSLTLGDVFTDAGATATDQGSAVAVVVTGSVDTGTAGVYTVTYTATDALGNAANTSRTVTVVVPPPPPAPAPEPAPTPSSGGGGGGNGVIGGPLAVGFQIPFVQPVAIIPVAPAPPPAQPAVLGATTAAPTPQPASVWETASVKVELAPVEAPAPEPVVTPAPVTTPWDIPTGEQIPLAAAAATSGFEVNIPLWMGLAALFGITASWWLWRRQA